MTISADPKQAAVDAAVAAMAASNPDILTAPSDAADIAHVLRPIEAAKARERMLAGKEPPAKLAEGKSRKRVAKAVGMSHQTLAKAEEVVSASEADPRDAIAVAVGPERLRLARERRAAFRKAMAALRTRGQANVEPIQRALANADVDGIVTAVVSHALGQFLDENCQRAYTTLHELSAGVESELVAATFADAPQILATLPDDGTPEVSYIRRLATDATTLNQHVVDARGQPTAPRPPSLSLNQTMVPR